MIIAIFVACGLGAVLRYGLSFLNRRGFPYGTLAVNLLAAFLAGYLSQRVTSSLLKTILLTGFLGGLGTYSSLNAELLGLLDKRWRFALYLILTYGLGIILVLLGMLL